MAEQARPMEHENKWWPLFHSQLRRREEQARPMEHENRMLALVSFTAWTHVGTWNLKTKCGSCFIHSGLGRRLGLGTCDEENNVLACFHQFPAAHWRTGRKRGTCPVSQNEMFRALTMNQPHGLRMSQTMATYTGGGGCTVVVPP